MKLFVFGSTGDLVKRKVLPALHSLQKKDLKIYAIGRRDFDHKKYHKFACTPEHSQTFKQNLHYIKIDYDSNNFCDNCFDFLDTEKTNYFYIALPPKLYAPILNFLGNVKKQGFKIQILIEKPFGENLKSSEKLIKTIEKNNLKNDLFLSDHYLFKKSILNLKKNDFKKIKLTFTEKVGLEGRTTFYDDTGVLKDMIQSHILNILFKIMPDVEDLNNFKIEKHIRGQYGDGQSKGYVKELGKHSNTETFIYLKLKTKNKTIKIISGKALNEKQSEIKIDEKKIIVDLENSYISLFNDFFLKNKKRFPSLENTLFSWKIIEKISKDKTNLTYYKKGAKLDEVIK